MEFRAEIKYEGTRKALVKDIAEAIGAEVKYQGAPTFAYKVGDFTITRDNMLVYDTETADMQSSIQLGRLMQAGRFEYANEEFTLDGEPAFAEPTQAPQSPESTPEGINPQAEPESPTEANTERTDADYEDAEWLSVCMPDDLTVEQKANLYNLLEQKADLFRQAFPRFNGIAFTCEDGKNYIEFPWFSAGEDATPYILFVAKLIGMVKAAKRISTRPQRVTNPKYQMRCFLLRLGFIGKEYGPARKVILGNLVGNSAWLRGSK